MQLMVISLRQRGAAAENQSRRPLVFIDPVVLCYKDDMDSELTQNSRAGENRFVESSAPSEEPRVTHRKALCSVIVPAYNERDNVHAVYDALCKMALNEPTLDWEFLFVDDGSTDDTFCLVGALNRTDPRVKAVRLSRNYGFHIAVAAGLQFVSGDAAVILAGDLQDHPREIHRFLVKWREGFHVVWGVRATRQDSRVDRFFSAIFSALIRRIALPNYPKKGTGSFCLLDRKIIDSVNTYSERHRMTFGLILSTGFRQTQIEYDRLERQTGVSKWLLRHKIKLSIDTIVSFSSLPIRLTSVLGIIIAALSFVYAGYLTVETMLYGRTLEGWTSIIVIMLGLGGLQLFVLGMLGEYLWRVGDEVRRRPLFLVQEFSGDFPRIRQSPGNRPHDDLCSVHE
jgi:glycosyltransferase involved in cell wall biosynthesis